MVLRSLRIYIYVFLLIAGAQVEFTVRHCVDVEDVVADEDSVLSSAIEEVVSESR